MAGAPWKKYAKGAVKAGVAVVVLLFVGRHVARTWNDLHRPGKSLHVDARWAAAGGVLYVAGLTAFGAYFGRIMAASRTPVGASAAVRAYVISHLGKYVPGKAMVVVMRVGLVVPYGARPATAAIATFYETLVMMAAGSLLAAVGFGLGSSPVQVIPAALAAGLAVAFLIVVDPKIFPKLSKLLTMPFPDVGPDALPTLSYRLLLVGLAWCTVGWALLGLSQVAVVRAVSPVWVDPKVWPVIAAGVALATVAGFVVAVLPAGLGVREGVLITTLAPALGDKDTAVVAALALRLTWVVAEIASAAVFAVARPARPGATEP